MLFRRVSRSDPEKVFVVVKNSYSTASLANGYVVEWDASADADGVGVTLPSTACMTTGLGVSVAGVAAETIAHNTYGLVQVYGYHSAVRVRACTSDDVIVAHTGLRPALAGGFCAEGHDPNGTLNYRTMGFALAAYSSWTTTTMAAFIKAL